MIIPYRFLQPPWVSACNCLRFISAMALATPVKKRKVTTEPASSEKVPWHALMRTVSLFRLRFPWCFGILTASYLLLSLWTPLEALDPGRRQADRDPWLGRWDWALVWWWWASRPKLGSSAAACARSVTWKGWSLQRWWAWPQHYGGVRKLDVVHVFAQKQGPAAAFGRILLAEHPDAKGLQSQPLVCRVHQNRCERQVVAHKA